MRTALSAVRELVGRPRGTPECVRPDLADGGPGLVLAYHQLDRCRPGEGWGAKAQDYLAASAAGAERLGGTSASPGLYGGLAGLSFAAWTLTHDPGVLPEVHDSVVRQAIERAHALAERPPERAIDLISGLTGTGAYLLCRHDEPAAGEALRAVLAALVSATEDLKCGMAHGSSGPLALLCLAAEAHVVVAGQHEAVARLVDRQVDPQAMSWCRGRAGVARALWLAGVALDDTALCDRAVRMLKATHRRPAAAGHTGLCHGQAGLLHITARFAQDTGDPELVVAADLLTAELAAAPTPSGAGLLDGAAGVVLALLTVASGELPTWERALLLS